MPTIKIFANCRIVMYFDDHLPAHFHVITADHREALVAIEDNRILAGLPTREIREALDWAAEHRALRAAKWAELN